jgi:hypothetical protein
MSSDEEELATTRRNLRPGKHRTRTLADDGDSSDDGDDLFVSDNDSDAVDTARTASTASFSAESLKKALVRRDHWGSIVFLNCLFR